MQRYSSTNMDRLMAQVRASVNITFPQEFGHPVIYRDGPIVTAAFPPEVRLRTPSGLNRAVGEGSDAASALANLCNEYTDVDFYQQVEVLDRFSGKKKFFHPISQPYGIEFRQIGA